MQVQDIVRRMPEVFDAGQAGDIEATVQYQLSQPMYLVIKGGECRAHEGALAEPDVTLSASDEHFLALVRGELNAMNAFMTGKLQIDGDLVLAQRVATLFDFNQL